MTVDIQNVQSEAARIQDLCEIYSDYVDALTDAENRKTYGDILNKLKCRVRELADDSCEDLLVQCRTSLECDLVDVEKEDPEKRNSMVQPGEVHNALMRAMVVYP